MPRADFYLIDKPRFREDPLLLVCELAKRAFAAQQPTLILARSQDEAEAIDERLWDFDDDAFIPHQIAGDDDDAMTPVLIAPPGVAAEDRALVINLRDDCAPGLFERVLEVVPATEGRLLLQRGDRLRVVAQPTADLATTTDAPSNAVSDAAHDATPDTVQAAPLPTVPTVPCTLPEVFSQVQAGERIWFDDGRIGGVVKTVSPDGWVVEITQARDGGERLASDKGINLPDSLLDLPALTPKDVDDLAVAARLADMVGLSFVQRAQDVEELRNRLAALGAGHLGIVLKIETRRAFENLPALMLSAMASPASGLMIARGDLAVECGHERLAEIQEELLWAAEAAHMPVIWATQVLETLAKTGLPSRAEITDAAMGERAECVMLNKGPHILQAMHTLDGILRRMQGHQSKKRSLLRALGSWTTSLQNK